MPDSFVVVLGVGTVFFGLICLVLLCKIIGFFCNVAAKKEKSTAVTENHTPATLQVQPIENREEIVAAVSAVIAEELGTDVSALRILSFKKI